MLEVSHVTKRFGGLVAVDDLSLHIGEGEILGLIGPNGAGKTTTFNLISGFYRPDSGKVTFKGDDITELRPDEVCKKGIARTFQLVKPFSNMTIFDNILCGALTKTSNLEKAKEEAAEIINLIGMSQKQNVLAKNLTLASRKLLDLGRSLATKPSLLLIDEIAAGLNPAEITEVIGLIQKIHDMGITLCIVEHVMKFIMSVANRIVVLDMGRKISEGAPEEVSRDKEVIKAYLGEMPSA